MTNHWRIRRALHYLLLWSFLEMKGPSPPWAEGWPPSGYLYLKPLTAMVYLVSNIYIVRVVAS